MAFPAVSYEIVEFPPNSLDPELAALAKWPDLRRRRLLHKTMKDIRPRHLYRFYDLPRARYTEDAVSEFPALSVKKLRDIVVESLFYLSRADSFNDPFDMTTAVDMSGDAKEREKRIRDSIASALPGIRFKQREQRVRDAMSMSPKDEGRRISQFLLDAALRFGVCCFSAGDPRDVLMWSHYARSHTGVCLQFQFSMDPQVFARAVHVEYADEYPILRYYKSFYDDIEPMLTRKHSRWRYEQECRMLHPDGAEKFVRFNAGALTAIVLGCQTDNATEIEIRTLLSEREARGLPAVRVYRAQKHPARYELKIHSSPGVTV
jgi:hypothetical protein